MAVQAYLLVVLWTVLFVYKAYGGIISQYNWKRNTALDNYISTSGHRSSFYTRSRYHCGGSCFRDSHCYSFFYNENTALCNLEGTVKLSTTGLAYQLGTRYYPMTDVQLSRNFCPPDDNDFHVTKLTDGSHIRFRAYRTSKVNVNTAISICNSAGGRVFQPIGQSKNAFLQALRNCPGYAQCYWLDGKKDSVFDQWSTWDHSHFFGYVNWGGGNPNYPTFEFCLAAIASTGMWNDIACDQMCYVLCEKDL